MPTNSPTLLDQRPAPRDEIVTAASRAAEPERAVAELAAAFEGRDLALILFFCGAEYDLQGVLRGLSRHFPRATLAGCTTAGEITPDGYAENSMVAIGLPSESFVAEVRRLAPLSRLRMPEAAQTIHAMRRAIDARADPEEWPNSFAFVLFDAMAQREETVVGLIARALGSVPLFGGSAGDGLKFERTWVYAEGSFVEDAAVVALIRTKRPIKLFMSQHVATTERKMVVTRADPPRRIVTEINAEPAASEYARIVGVAVEDLSPLLFAQYPVVVRIGGHDYVRAIQRVNPDGSLSFYCAIDEGIVLTVAEAQDLVVHLETVFDDVRGSLGEPDLILGCDCVLRRLEAEQRQIKREVGALMRANRVIGFATFGEQFASMHVNQTFTGVAIGRPEGARR